MHVKSGRAARCCEHQALCVSAQPHQLDLTVNLKVFFLYIPFVLLFSVMFSLPVVLPFQFPADGDNMSLNSAWPCICS